MNNDDGFRGTDHKIVGLSALLTLRQSWRLTHQTLVFTNGCFDLLHVGHITSLEYDRGLGQRLVVGLNSDLSVRRLKGPARPIVCQADRARVLAALACVDAVCIFDAATAAALVTDLRPEVYAKGSDYGAPGSEWPEAAIVIAAGGRVATTPYVAGRSTTDLIAAILSANG